MAKNMLLWVQQVLKERQPDVTVTNMNKDWASGQAFGALLFSLCPEALPQYPQMQFDHKNEQLCLENLNTVFDAAAAQQLPRHLDAEDCFACLNEQDKSIGIYLREYSKSVTTYLQEWHKKFSSTPSPNPSLPSPNPSLGSTSEENLQSSPNASLPKPATNSTPPPQPGETPSQRIRRLASETPQSNTTNPSVPPTALSPNQDHIRTLEQKLKRTEEQLAEAHQKATSALAQRDETLREWERSKKENELRKRTVDEAPKSQAVPEQQPPKPSTSYLLVFGAFAAGIALGAAASFFLLTSSN